MNVEITKAVEPWVVLTLADGSILKGRMNIAAVQRVEGAYDVNGRPAYVFNPQMQVELIPNESLCTKKPLIPAPSGVPGHFVEGNSPTLAAHPTGDANAHAAAERLMGGSGAG